MLFALPAQQIQQIPDASREVFADLGAQYLMEVAAHVITCTYKKGGEVRPCTCNMLLFRPMPISLLHLVL